MSARKKAIKYDPLKYGKLLAAVQPKLITSEKENDHFLEIIAQLLRNDARTPEENLLMSLLISLVEVYESEAYQGMFDELEPLDLLKSLMADHKMARSELARLLNSESRATEVLAGKRTISRAMAAKLGEYFKLDPRAFLSIKQNNR
jgi:HTH-type transcriptional regulator / antitoxin HigA